MSMPVYTVHAPPADRAGANSSTPATPEDFAFVRDGVYVWALIFGPLWLLFSRLWLVLVVYVVVMAAIGFGLWATGLRQILGSWPLLFAAVLLGLEAGTLRRWTLARRGWRNVGIVVADNLEAAERRFFDRFVETGTATRAPSSSSYAPPRPTAPAPVIGLFPEPGAGR
jgi:hypothetical protein